jgi:hypothetical protein
MDRDEGQSILGNGFYLGLVNHFGLIVLCRDDGTEVARFSVWDATSDAIEQAAHEDLRNTYPSSILRQPSRPKKDG